jgi:hypothetical protein
MILPYLDEAPRYNTFNCSDAFAWGWNNGSAYGTAANGVTSSNLTAQTRALAKYTCPSDPASSGGYPILNYYGVSGGGNDPGGGSNGNYPCSSGDGRVSFNSGMFYRNSRTNMRDLTDGTSNVFMLGESHYGFRPGQCCEMTSWASGGRYNNGDDLETVVIAGCVSPNSYTGSVTTSSYNPFTASGTKLFGSYHVGGVHMARADGSINFVSNNIDLLTFQQLCNRADGLPIGGNNN